MLKEQRCCRYREEEGGCFASYTAGVRDVM